MQRLTLEQSVSPEDIDKDWLKQRWWQAVIDSARTKQWECSAPIRLRKLKELCSSRYAADVTALMSESPGFPELSATAWRLAKGDGVPERLATTGSGGPARVRAHVKRSL